MTNMNMVPEFTDDTVQGTGVTPSVTEPVVEETLVEKETLAESPTEQIAELKPVEAKKVHDDGLAIQIQGLQEERAKLLKEVQELRGTKREIRREELVKIDQRIETLQDVNPDDVALIDKVLRSKGYLTKEESQKMFYESVKQEQINHFLEKFPEYKPENDPNDVNWNTLQREFSIYAFPTDPKLIGDRLERAHKAIAKPPTQDIEVKRQQLKAAGAGSSGVQRSSSSKALDPDKRAALERGGWSEEEIKRIESKL